jgi:hypothetical protein
MPRQVHNQVHIYLIGDRQDDIMVAQTALEQALEGYAGGVGYALIRSGPQQAPDGKWVAFGVLAFHYLSQLGELPETIEVPKLPDDPEERQP